MMIKTKTSQTIEPAKHLQQKDLLGLRDLTPEEILLILNTADTMKMILSAKQKRTAHLQGKSVVTLFYENSTRTRLSFELASKFLGSVSANISVSGSSISKGENLYDTCKTIDVMATDFIIMRHPHSGAPHRMRAFSCFPCERRRRNERTPDASLARYDDDARTQRESGRSESCNYR